MIEKTYYHFLSSKNVINDLENEWIKVSTMGELNDPFELRPYLRFQFKERKPYNEIFRKISNKWGLLCFSDDWSEPLLWSYYADKHKGVAIGFQILRDEILKVNYTSDTKRQRIKLINNKDIDEEAFLSLAKVKYKKWEYENEYRVLLELKDCLFKKCILLKSRKLHFVKFKNRLKVKKIVLGCKFEYKKEIGKIKKLANKFDAEIIPTRVGWEDYKIRQCGTKTQQYIKDIKND